MIKVVFFGTPKIALKSLEYLYSSDNIEVVGVVTQPDKPAGRGHKISFSPIKQFALDYNIPVFQPKSIKKDDSVIQELKALAPDFFVTFAFGQILSQEVLDIPKFDTINLHASLLPKYRGANPIQRAIINGDKETGICTMITELGLDCGDVCLKQVISISDDMNCMQLFDKVSDMAPVLLEKTIVDLYNGILKPVPQSNIGVCIANKLSKDETKIDWNKSACDIYNLIRGIYKSPSAYFEYNGKMIKVLEAKIVEEQGNCGEFLRVTKEGIVVGCGHNCLLLLKVKPEGKAEMPAKDWYNGLRK